MQSMVTSHTASLGVHSMRMREQRDTQYLVLSSMANSASGIFCKLVVHNPFTAMNFGANNGLNCSNDRNNVESAR